MSCDAGVVAETNLAGTWQFLPENGAWTSIQVPGGGWLKQGFDCEAGTYQRRITIPNCGQPQVVHLELEAVNHLAEIYLGVDEASLEKIHTEVTAFTPQVVDLTPHVSPGQEYLLRIYVRAYQNGRPIAPHWAEWCECIARGLLRGAWLRVYPEIYIADAHIKTSVNDRTLAYDVWVTNASAQERRVTLNSKLESWNGDDWPYPVIPHDTLTVPAGSTVQVSIGPVAWTLGAESYWWPNLPYQQDYRAKLHLLELSATDDRAIQHTASFRFGFRQSQQIGPYYTFNGVRVNYRGDNLQVANYDRIDCGGKGDAIDTLPGFLPPSGTNPGWPKAVDNFLRLNYTVQRQHMGPWSPYMLDVCDELGLMLIGESATRWDGFDMEGGRGFHEVKCLQDIIRRDKNHPSIIRWSAKNEAQSTDPAYHVELYEAIKAIDDTRPIGEDIVWADWNVFDPQKVFALLLDKPDFTWIDHYLSYNNAGQPYFTTIQHSDAVIPMAERPFGSGESDWMRSSTPAGLTWFAATIVLARLQGASDVRPYVLLSSWASAIPGVKTTDFLTEENRRPVYGEDNLPNPWSHPGIRLLQTACHPLLAADAYFWKLNRQSDAFGHFPVAAPALPANATVTREITVFNDELSGDQLELTWEIREGHPANWLWDQGRMPLTIQPGFSRKVPVTFRTTRFNTFLFLNLKVYKDGIERFNHEVTSFEIAGGEDFRSEFNGEERKFK